MTTRRCASGHRTFAITATTASVLYYGNVENTAPSVKALYTAQLDNAQKLVPLLPESERPYLRTIIKAQQQFSAMLKASGWVLNPDDPAVQKWANTPPAQQPAYQAGKHLDPWLESTCHLSSYPPDIPRPIDAPSDLPAHPNGNG